MHKSNHAPKKKHHHSDNDRFFHSKKEEKECINQTVNVEVHIDQKEDCMTSCFSALSKCFKKGASS